MRVANYFQTHIFQAVNIMRVRIDLYVGSKVRNNIYIYIGSVCIYKLK